MSAAQSVAALRRRPELESARTLPEGRRDQVTLGALEVDAAFDSGGLAATGSHEIAAASPGDTAAAALFALGLVARLLQRRPGRSALVVQEAQAGAEAGLLYGPGLHALGIDPDRLLLVTARDAAGALRVVDEATRSGAPAAVVAELREPARIDLKTTRRFNLAGERTGVAALLLTSGAAPTSAALSRWRVASAPSRSPGAGLMGAPALHLELTRNRHGRLGAWTVEWSLERRVFQLATDLVPVVSAPAYRPFGPGWDQFAGDADGGRRAVG